MKPKDAKPRRDAHRSPKDRERTTDDREPTEGSESRAAERTSGTEQSSKEATSRSDTRKPQPSGSRTPPVERRTMTEHRAPLDETHERELDAVKHVKSAQRPSKPSPPERGAIAPAPRAAPLPPVPPPVPETSTGLERVVTRRDEDAPEEQRPLEERVTRSSDPRDLARMRTLADKVYQQGWNHLSTDEQLAFMYHARFLDYLSAKEKEREDVQATMYRFVSAQGKSLGLKAGYSANELSVLNDRFFGTIRTPQNSPELYRELANTDYLKADRRR